VTLAGPTCDSVDVVARRVPLPPLADGDLLVSPMMGAYTWATATGFNGIARTPVVEVASA
jgi:ornithine decarboxylase